MVHTITIKIWDNKDNHLITNKRIRIIDEYATSRIGIPFDELLFNLIQEGTTYEIRVNDIPVTIYKTYKSGKWLVIEYNGGS